MKKLIFISIITLVIAGCYVIPKGIPVLPDHTISIPLGDTLISFLEIAESNPDAFRIAGDTVYARTQMAAWRTEGYAIPCSLQAHMNIEENLPEDIIDLDSTYFTTSVDKIINTVHIWGEVPVATNGRIRHYIYDRDRNMLYLDSMYVSFPATAQLDTVIEYEITDFPFGDYQHDVDVITEYGFMRIDSIDTFSEIALKFHMGGDRVMTVLKEQSLWIPNPAADVAGDDSILLSPPDSTPISLINSILLQIDIWNRLPLGTVLRVYLLDSLESPVFIDSINIVSPELDSAGRATGMEPAYTLFDIQLDTSIYHLFDYSLFRYKADLWIPPASTDSIFVTPEDYIRLRGRFVVNYDIDPYILSNEFEFINPVQ